MIVLARLVDGRDKEDDLRPFGALVIVLARLVDGRDIVDRREPGTASRF